MPLTVELFDDNKKEYGYLVIDRNNLIFQFLPKGNSLEDSSEAKNKIAAFVSSIKLSPSIIALQAVSDINDSRHSISDHVCESDIAVGYHLHLKFKNNINLDIILDILDDIPESTWLQVISQDCYNGLDGIIVGYFREQRRSESKLSPSPAAIELEYQIEKNAQFELKTDQLKLQKPLQPFAGMTNDLLFLLMMNGSQSFLAHAMFNQLFEKNTE